MAIIRQAAGFTHKALLATAALLAFGVATAIAQDTITYDASQWAGLKYREAGPYRGGRVTTVTGVPSQPQTFYFGGVGGGVWKTTDAGHNWVNLTDGQISVGSIGAVEVSQSDPNIIYVGTGSGGIRSNVSIGRGMYKSTDAGKTWQFIGLRDTGQIPTVRVNPTNPDEVFVASIGDPFKATKERGVYRTRDGGKTWKQVLFLTDELGAADLEMQPGHPDVLFACMWHGRRKPWSIVSGSMDGGIYKSTDGGDTWHKLGGGLPTSLFGRSHVAISASNPDRIWALIEAKPGQGVYRSDDTGKTWKLVNGADRLITRPFYYDEITVDPHNADILWVGDESWMKSIDGGKTFRNMPEPHGDNHGAWINPNDSKIMIQANDGGADVSMDGGLTWSSQLNQPTAEIYQVALDDQFPYRIYGAQQDDETVIVPSLPLGNGQTFRTGPGCETGPIIPKMGDPTVVWGGCKGQFTRLNINTNANEERYWVGDESLYGNEPSNLKYRFQRVSPMEISPFEPNTVYYGSQFVHRSKDGGVNWQTLSPDLTAHPEGTQYGSGEPITRDATGEEVYSTLYSIRESPLKKGLIWTGSNDGLIFVTQDDGLHWTNITPKDMPPGGRIQQIDPSPHKPGTAYVAYYRYLLGDFAPYLYRTDDYGKTWTKLTDGTNGIAPDEPTRVVREDPVHPGLLYAGTEFGMYISFDNGKMWKPFQQNLPAVVITDIKLAHNDMVISTQGRGFWIMDNLSVLRQLPAPSAANVNKLYKPAKATRIPAAGARGGGRNGEGPQYPLEGAQIDYYLAADATAPVEISIMDTTGKVIRTFTSVAEAAPRGGRGGGDEGGGGDEEGFFRVQYPSTLDAKAGEHRFTWDLRVFGPWVSEARPQGPNGPVVPPGLYTVQIKSGDWTAKQPLELVEDPRVTKDGVTTLDLKAQYEHNLKAMALVSDLNKTVARIRAAQAKMAKDPSADPAKVAALKAVADKVITSPIRYSQPVLNAHITYLYSENNMTDQKIGHDAVERLAVLRKQLDVQIAALNAVLGPQ
jgi:photosystem II stability/assembly factor-like uncharacterized protein